MSHRIVIIGAGIAGLGCGIALRKLRLTADIFEQSRSVNPVGAGIALTYNAMLALKVIGIPPTAFSNSLRFGDFQINDSIGHMISTIPFSSKELKGLNFVLARHTLHQILLSHLDMSRVHLEKRLDHLEEKAGKYKMYFGDGSVEEADIVIGADGIHSQVRRWLSPSLSPRAADYVCWRGMVSNSFGLKNGFETWGKKGRVGVIPLSNEQIYWFACVNGRDLSSYTKRDLVERFKDYRQPVSMVINSTLEENILYNPIFDLKPSKHFAKNRVLLIGDAAHATTPNMGQGACQALEDVALLHQLLKSDFDFEKSFKDFEQLRKHRTQQIIRLSRLAGKVAQFENPLAIAIRNILMRAVPYAVRKHGLIKILTAFDFKSDGTI